MHSFFALVAPRVSEYTSTIQRTFLFSGSMKRTFIYSIILTLIIGASLALVFVRSSRTDKAYFTIVCTTGMIADAVRNIVRDQAHVVCLMGPGVDPHLYRAKESDVHTLAQAHLIFYNGLHLEGRLDGLLHELTAWVPAHAIADALDAQDIIAADFEAVYDPHIWHSVLLWQKVVQYIAERVAQYDPSHAAWYRAHAHAYVQQLEDLHADMLHTIATIPAAQRVLVTAHDAFSYFGKTYGFEVIGLQGMSTDAQVSVRDIQQLVDTMIARNIHALFLESSITSRTLCAVQDALRARGHAVQLGAELFSDALGDTKDHADTYIGMMKHNVASIVRGLRF